MIKDFGDMNNVTVGIVLFNSRLDRVILIKRERTSVFQQKYSVPGGRVKLGEDLQTAIIREVYEETKITLDKITYLCTYEYQGIYMVMFASVLDEENSLFVSLNDTFNLDLAPNIKESIQKSHDYFIHRKNMNIDLRQVKADVINRVAECVITKDDNKGWGHFLQTNVIGIIGTAIGLEIINGTESYSDLKESICKSIINFQLEDGGWSTKSGNNKNSITGSTCACLVALHGQYNCKTDVINHGIQWLMLNQLEDKLWGDNIQSQDGRIIQSCVAANTLKALSSDVDLSSVIARIWECQNEDGGWGFKDHQISNLSATSFAILTLSDFPHIDNHQLKKAIKWITEYISNNTIVDQAEFEYVGDTRVEFKHSTIIYVLSALLKLRNLEYINSQFLYDSINSIIMSRKDNGFWEHSLTPGAFSNLAHKKCSEVTGLIYQCWYNKF